MISISMEFRICLEIISIPSEMVQAFLFYIIMHICGMHALPTRWYSVYTLIYQTVCAKWYCIQKQKWYYRTAVRFMVSFFFQHQQYALFTALQFHFLRLICINPNNFTAGFVSGNESRKTITNPKLLMMR